jgi:probable rRNA maturation factor
VSFTGLWQEEAENLFCQIKSLVKQVQESFASDPARKPCSEHSIIECILSEDAVVRELNARYRKKDAPTNVLSFPQDSLDQVEGFSLFGSVILAYETVRREAQEQRKSFLHHSMHLILHGILHLFGCDHETSAEAETMETLERQILATLEVPDPYGSP